MPVVRDRVATKIVEQLEQDDTALVNADAALREAQFDHEVASRKYAVQRDIAMRRLGFDPYKPGEALVVSNGWENRTVEFPSGGRFRYLHMDVGDALIKVLTEGDEPMSLDELVVALRRGGIAVPMTALTRGVNAALINKAGIGKTDDDPPKYFLNEDDTLDDLPF